jgi:isopropylmalate/homocitrate/citramalate synthase
VGLTVDGLIFDWNSPATASPAVADELLCTRWGAPLSEEARGAVLARLGKLGIRCFRLPSPEALPLLPPGATGFVELPGHREAGAEAARLAANAGLEVGVDARAPDVLSAARAAGLYTWVQVAVTEDLEVAGAAMTRGLEAGASGVLLDDRADRGPDVAADAVRAALEVAPGRPVAWRGSNRAGVGVAAALAAAEAGAVRVWGTFLGIGPPGASVPLDQVMVSLDLAGAFSAPLTGLADTTRFVAETLDWPIPRNYPVAGLDAFRTATGVHAAAIVKALAKGDAELADRVYSGVPAGRYGRGQVIDVGPMSGMSNVRHWLALHGIEPTEALTRAIFERAKGARRVLGSAELRDLIAKHR